jgi:hypothetical protein
MMSPIMPQRGIHDNGYQRPAASVWLDQNRDLLPDGEWVAANDQGIVAHDTSMTGLIVKIQNSQIEMKDVVISFIERGPIT